MRSESPLVQAAEPDNWQVRQVPHLLSSALFSQSPVDPSQNWQLLPGLS